MVNKTTKLTDMDDLLGAALRSAKGMPSRSKSRSSQNNHKSLPGFAKLSSKSRSTLSRSNSPKPNSASNSFERHFTKNPICSFCESESAAICISKSLSKTTIPLCLAHYYTTRSCRIDPKKVSVVDEKELSSQLHYANDLFAEAFTELQKDISIQSAKSFHEMSRRGSDPLSILNDTHSRPKINTGRMKSKKPASFHSKISAKDGNAEGGGFMKHIKQKEIDLRQLQNERIQNNQRYANSNNSYEGRSAHMRQEGGSRYGHIVTKAAEINPYKRRKLSAKSSWHHILNENENHSSDLKVAYSSDKLLLASTEMVVDKKCSCGGGAILFGNTSSRNNDVPKAEIWGTKRDTEMVRYQCRACAKIWNEEE